MWNHQRQIKRPRTSSINYCPWFRFYKVASLPGITYVEGGAGGVLSQASASIQNTSGNHSRTVTSIGSKKARGWSTQADLYRSLNLPVVLIGDCRLGGISSTLTALEALLFRGHFINALVMVRMSGLEQDSSMSRLVVYV